VSSRPDVLGGRVWVTRDATSKPCDFRISSPQPISEEIDMQQSNWDQECLCGHIVSGNGTKPSTCPNCGNRW
jgi:hypothetical protein